MRKTDINKYVGTPGSNMDENHGSSAATTAKSTVKILLKAILTIFIILAISGAIVAASLISFIMSMKDEGANMDLGELKLDYTSFIYVNDKNGNPVEYQRLYSSQNRVWVSYDKIPKSMKDAMVAIEDKRFYDHQGVDWFSTFGAATKLFVKGGGSGGGSTLTQQLIKNITGESQVSLTRKVKEIFSAINLEKKYSKDQILEAYLNVVNYGSGCQGVQAAANLYFNKDISQCDIAECAAIAGITKSPSYYSPLISEKTRENNKIRQQTVIQAMYDQGKISKAEYDTAMAKSEHMVFSTKKSDEAVDATPIQNWYIDAMFDDVVADLQTHYNCSKEEAESKMYHAGLKIYSAMDTSAQTIAENTMKDPSKFTSDSKIQMGYFMMDYSGRVLATVGSRGTKTGNRLFSNAIDAKRQPGSSIKPISSYLVAVETGKLNYSTLMNDEPVENYFPDGSAGPTNWYKKYNGLMTANHALEISSNAVAAQICKIVSPKACYNFLTDKLHFSNLNAKTDSVEVAAMAIGGLNGGVTVKEMTSAYQIFGNGGKYFKPYTYYYVKDHDGNVILDNRKEIGSQVISSSTSTILHKLMRNVIYGPEGTGRNAAISGWNEYGKTGTTDFNKDSWFVGGTPYAVAGIWTGYSTPKTLSNTTVAISVWKDIMKKYLSDKPKLNFNYDTDVVQATFCKDSGKLAGPNCTHTDVGWYKKGTFTEVCDGTHPSSSSTVESGILPSSSSSSNSSSVPADSGSGTTTSLPPTSNSSTDVGSNSSSSFASQPNTASSKPQNP